jgi:hypothetical protein
VVCAGALKVSITTFPVVVLDASPVVQLPPVEKAFSGAIATVIAVMRSANVIA